jgi:hypothetical protein
MENQAFQFFLCLESSLLFGSFDQQARCGN